MGARFSVVYPTRHRPEFMRQALDILESQGYDDFEVIVCDNYVDHALSCEAIARDSSLPNLEYVRPPRPMGMVENWNHALQFATGDYVCYLTDKMFVLPDALGSVAQAIDAAGRPEIVSWPSDAFNPASFADYFGDGVYFSMGSDVRSSRYQPFSPPEELERRGQAEVSRTEQSSADYSRGKIVFGAYRRDLLQRMVQRFGAAFHNISPDYTSMVLGLAEARDAIHMDMTCVVSVNTDISNGALVDNDDAAALGFLNSLAGGAESILPNLLVPGLYASVSNLVAHDLLTLKRTFGFDFAFNTTNWLVYCHEDIYRPDRRWSDPRVEAAQKRLLRTFIDSLGKATAAEVRARLSARAKAKAPTREWRVPFSRTARRAWQRLASSSTGTAEITPEPEPIGPPDRIPAPSLSAAVESFVAARS